MSSMQTGSTLEEASSNDLTDIARIIIGNMYGEVGEKVFNYLVENGYIAEEKIVNTIDVRSNEARKVLQKLSDEAVVISDKIREGGEVLHIWRLNKPALKTFVLDRLKRTREKLLLVLKYEQEGYIYQCETCKRRFKIDEAYANGFICPHDNGVLVELNNPVLVEEIKAKLKRIDVLISKIERS